MRSSLGSRKKPSLKGSRHLKVRVKTAKKRSLSSTRWLQRQLNDPYVAKAHAQGFRSRAAYKLSELDDVYHFLSPGSQVVDLGATPGGWTQVAFERTKVPVISVDLVPMDPPLPYCHFVLGDFTDDATVEKVKALLGDRKANVVLTDMAAPATGHRQTDHLKIMGLVDYAWDFALKVLAPEGTFVAKVLQGGTEKNLLMALKENFMKVYHAKPPASRKDSRELYVLAKGFKG